MDIFPQSKSQHIFPKSMQINTQFHIAKEKDWQTNPCKPMSQLIESETWCRAIK